MYTINGGRELKKQFTTLPTAHSFIYPFIQQMFSTRGQTAEARRTTVLQPVEQKPHSQKDRQDEKAEEQDKTPEKQLNEVEIGNLPEKEFRIMIVKMIQDLGIRMEAKGFPGGAVVESLPANAGDVPRSGKIPHAAERLGP